MQRKRLDENDERKRKLKTEKRLEQNDKESKRKNQRTNLAPLVMNLSQSDCRPVLQNFYNAHYIPTVQNPILAMLSVTEEAIK